MDRIFNAKECVDLDSVSCPSEPRKTRTRWYCHHSRLFQVFHCGGIWCMAWLRSVWPFCLRLGRYQVDECVFGRDRLVQGTKVLPVASTDSRVFELCARSCSAGTDARVSATFLHFTLCACLSATDHPLVVGFLLSVDHSGF